MCRGIFALLLLVLFAARGSERPQKVAFASLPAAVQRAVQARLDQGKVGAVERTTENSAVTYSVEIIRRGQERSYTFAPDGSLVSVEVALDETPTPVQATIRAEAGASKIVAIEKSATDGTYDVTVEKGGRESSFTVSADGTLLSVEMTLAETPPSVQATIKSAVGPATIVHLEKSIAPEKTTFDVDFTRTGRQYALSVDEEGALLSIEISLADTPAPVQAAIRAQTAQGTIDRIEKNLEAGRTVFDVDFTGAGRKQTFRVGENGKLLSVRVGLAETPAPARQAIVELLGDATLLSIDHSLIKKGKIFPYEIHSRTKDGKTYDFIVGPQGRSLGTDE